MATRSKGVIDTEIESGITNQVLNDHPDVETIIPPFDYNSIGTEFPPDTWLKPADLTFNVSWTDTGANPVATILNWGGGSTADVTTFGSYPAVRMASNGAGCLTVGLNGNNATTGTDWTQVFHIERMSDVGANFARVNGWSNTALAPSYDNLFNVNAFFSYIAGTAPNAGKVQTSYGYDGATAFGGPLPVNTDPILASEGTSIIYRWVDSTKMMTVIDCTSGEYISVNLPGLVFTNFNVTYFGGNNADGSSMAQTVTDIAWWNRALTELELEKLSSAFCTRYMTTPAVGPQDKQVLAFRGDFSKWRPKSLNASDIVGFNESAIFATGSRQNNYTATVAPTATDNTANGYDVGSIWIDTTPLSGEIAYICVRATAPAFARWVVIGT